MTFFTEDERAAIDIAVNNFKSTFRHYRFASWFRTWSDQSVEDAALRCYIGDMTQQGEKPHAAAHTAVAKFAANVRPERRFLVFASIPLVDTGGSLNRLGRIYRERGRGYAGDWPNSENELVTATLSILGITTLAVQSSSFAQLVAGIRLQRQKEQTGKVCQCGMRKTETPCDVCGC